MKMWIDNVQLAGGERALSCLITKSAQHRLDRNTSVSFKMTIVLHKEQKILQISEARKVLEGILINVHEVVGLLNSSAKRK